MSRLDSLLDGLPTRLEPAALPRREVDQLLARLDSGWTAECLARDPYWPKWDSPWWGMVLLQELGLAAEIPHGPLGQLIAAVDRHYLHTFPRTEAELPAGVDPVRQVMCHCGLATLYRLGLAAGLAMDRELPWARPWFLRYQQPDGGWNCDEGSRCGSMVSTVAVLEVWLDLPDLSEDELVGLQRGMDYVLTNRRLCRSSGDGRLISEDWLVPTFPRFYEYDVLRGLELATLWAVKRKVRLALDDLEESLNALRQMLNVQGQLRLGRSFALEATTLFELTPGHWERDFPATTFPLLEAVSKAGESCAFLTGMSLQVSRRLRQLESQGLLVE